VYAHLSLDLVDVCLHLQLWLSTTDPARHTASLFERRRLVDVDNMPVPSDRFRAARSQISRGYPRIIEAYGYVVGAAGLSGAPELPPEGAELRCVRLFEAFCSITDMAIALLRAKLEAYQIALKLGVAGDSRCTSSASPARYRTGVSDTPDAAEPARPIWRPRNRSRHPKIWLIGGEQICEVERFIRRLLGGCLYLVRRENEL
jgi:hypothetical protein